MLSETKTTISQLEIEATILGLKACEEHVEREADKAACRRAMRLIRTLQASLKGTLAVAQVNRDVAELARGIQIAHAAWIAIGAPGAWKEEDQDAAE